VDAFLESSDLRRLPCAANGVKPHESPSLILGSDSLDLSLSMMPDGKSDCYFS